MRLPSGERISTDRSGSGDPGSAWWRKRWDSTHGLKNSPPDCFSPACGRVALFSSPLLKPQVKESILALAASGREKEKAGHRTRIASRLSLVAEAVGFEPTSPCGLPDFESFPPCDFWWKLSEDGSTQRKPKSCGILRILASVFRFYLNPQGFPSSSHFCPVL